jgi:hypothetical protein
VSAWSHLPDGKQRYLDKLFRYLRQDNIEPIIDMIHDACRSIVSSPQNSFDHCRETMTGGRYKLFGEVGFEDLTFDEKRGPNVRLSYRCPVLLSGRRIHDSSVLEEGMLVALVTIHEDSKELNVIFFTVHLRESTDAMKIKTGNHTRASVRLNMADHQDIQKVREMTYYASGLWSQNVRHYLLDMPNVLPVAFMLHLARLQKLASSADFSFSDILCPEDPLALPVPHAPRTDKNTTMTYNLDCLKLDKNDSEDFVIDARDIDVAYRASSTSNRNYQEHSSEDLAMVRQIEERAGLDEGQATAFFEALNRDFSLIQGPPGCGKSFLGVKLAQIITKSRERDDSRPTILVCQTNHAVDDFLEGIVRAGYNRVVRLGPRSTASWIKPYTLHELRLKLKKSISESSLGNVSRDRIRSLCNQGLVLAEAISNPKNEIRWAAVKDYLEVSEPSVFQHFVSIERVDTQINDHRRARQLSFGFAFTFWLEGGDLTACQRLQEDIADMLGTCACRKGDTQLNEGVRTQIEKSVADHLSRVASSREFHWLWSQDMNTRQKLAKMWASLSNAQCLCDSFSEVHRRWVHAKNDERRAFDSADKMIVEQAKIDLVALTSTGFVRYWDLIDALEPQTIIFEEASELLEAHTTCCMVPSLKHCISIGDPKQLRPSCGLMVLSKENDGRYKHDESVFERLVEHERFPFSRLLTQRRAHPDLADLLRAGDYPFLQDHPSTLNRPTVQGLAQRMAWVDHSYPEDIKDSRSALGRSPSNAFEVAFISSLVRYLVQKQGYKFGEITILTPYKGQLAAFMRELADTCWISLTEQDRNALIDGGLFPDEESAAGTPVDVTISAMLRITTIDSYQGEQARVILFSPVRSNVQNTAGFLKNLNRINVAVSRAEDGLFVVGNSGLMATVGYWNNMISVFKAKNAFGDALLACCSRHVDQKHEVRQPEEFGAIPSCQARCSDVLPCGHYCHQLCHPPEMHTDGRMVCQSRCSKLLHCGHPCTKPCGIPCGCCEVEQEVMILECGHSVRARCGQSLDEIRCFQPVHLKTLETCGHEKAVLCSEQHLEDFCEAVCGHRLGCGHLCTSQCTECRANGRHGECTASCGHKMECGHCCDHNCHDPNACPPCEQVCNNSCQHKRCAHKCGGPCDPCTALVERHWCKHREEYVEPIICCMPRIDLPCSEPCTKLLPCGLHLCQSLCGEVCQSSCSECSSLVGSRSPVINLECLHSFNVRDLDEHMMLRDTHEVTDEGRIVGIRVTASSEKSDYRCPTCSLATTNTRRYHLANALTHFDHTCDLLYGKMAVFATEKFDRMRVAERSASHNLPAILAALKNGPLAARHVQSSILDKSSFVKEIQDEVETFCRTVAIPVESSIERVIVSWNNDVLYPLPALAFRLRLELVVLRGRMSMLDFGHQIISSVSGMPNPDKHTSELQSGLLQQVLTDAAVRVAQIDTYVVQCRTKQLPRLEAEMRLVQVAMWLILRAYSAESTTKLNPRVSLGVCLDLLETWPDTAGALWGPYRAVSEAFLSRRTLPSLPEIYGKGDRDPWLWKGYRPGHMIYCPNKHPYSQACFPLGCPECGTEKPLKPRFVALKPTIAPGEYRTTIDQEAANAFYRPTHLLRSASTTASDDTS